LNGIRRSGNGRWSGRQSSGRYGDAGRNWGSEPGAFYFVKRTLVLAWPGADDFGANVVERIRIVLDGLAALVGDRTGVRDALPESLDFWRAAGARCESD
jgi:hypothetical protein